MTAQFKMGDIIKASPEFTGEAEEYYFITKLDIANNTYHVAPLNSSDEESYNMETQHIIYYIDKYFKKVS